MSSILRFLFIVLFFKGSLLAEPIETIGDYGQVVLPISAGALSFIRKDKPGVAQFAESYFATYITVQALKHSINSRRPRGGGKSFPSGHTASSFAAATFLQLRYGWKYGIPAYLAASFVGYSRIESKKHWTYDVFAGAAIGIAYNLLFTKRYHLNICPYVDPESSGVAVSMNW